MVIFQIELEVLSIKNLVQLFGPRKFQEHKEECNACKTEYVVYSGSSACFDMIQACCQQISSEFFVLSTIVSAYSGQLCYYSKINQSELEFPIAPYSCTYIFYFEVTVRVAKTVKSLNSPGYLVHHGQCKEHPCGFVFNLFLPIF